MTIDTKHFEKKLRDEKILLEKELLEVARKNPDREGDWEAVPEEHDTVYEESTAGNSIDEYESNNAIVNSLEPKLQEIKEALQRIDEGTYGICRVCGEEIESDRLEANPAASTCKKHME